MRIGEDQAGFMVPSHVREYLKDRGFLSLPLEAMDEWIASWDAWMASRGDFYDYKDTDGLGRQYEVHRRSIKPAMRVSPTLIAIRARASCGGRAITFGTCHPCKTKALTGTEAR